MRDGEINKALLKFWESYGTRPREDGNFVDRVRRNLFSVRTTLDELQQALTLGDIDAMEKVLLKLDGVHGKLHEVIEDVVDICDAVAKHDGDEKEKAA